MSIVQKIDDRIKSFKKQNITDGKRIKKELKNKPSDYSLIKLLEIDIDRTEVAIKQLEWVLKQL